VPLRQAGGRTAVLMEWLKHLVIHIMPRGILSNGLKHGFQIHFGPDRMSEYHEGKKHGKYYQYKANGNIFFIENYYQGKKHGKQILYYYFGNQQWREDNFEHGKEHGIQLLWNSDGRLRFKEVYDCNTDTHVQYKMHNNQIIGEANYKKSKLHGVQRKWYDNGQLEYEENYSSGLKHGIKKQWDLSGKLVYAQLYENNGLVCTLEKIEQDENGVRKERKYPKTISHQTFMNI
jgi:antitoxin component YwqK of YwqJK toxin-antitoxin module